jgi:hypothetical protein
LKWLSESKDARVLHVFPQALNLVNEHERVLSVVVPSVGNGPFSLVVDLEEISGITGEQERVTIEENSLSVGELKICTGDAQMWQPVPDWGKIQPSSPDLIRVIESQLLGRQGGFYSNGSGKTTGYPFLERLAVNGTNFIHALLMDDQEAVQLHAGRLVGLGGGLTPAGDDFLMGAMVALRVTQPGESAERLSESIYQASIGRTTLLSQAWLEAARSGEAGEKWHALVDAAAAQEEIKVTAAVTQILNTGETSGADALTGFVQVLKMELVQ